MSGQTSPKAFISYSWSSDEHAQWVLDLASRLRNDGVETILDRWHLKTGQDKYEFMEQSVTDPAVNKLLMICDRLYAEKADSRRGGVGDETQIISPKIYGGADQRKFLPVIAERDENHQPYKPAYLTARMHIDLSDPQTFERGYEDLLRDIFEKPVHTPPPLGQPPSYLGEDGKAQMATSYQFTAFKSALLRDRPTAVGLAQDYLMQLSSDLRAYNLTELLSTSEEYQRGTAAGSEFYRNALTETVAASLPHRDEFIDFVLLISQYWADPRMFSVLQRFFGEVVSLIRPPESEHDHQPLEPFRFIVPEMFLYTVAGLLKNEHYETVAGMLSRTYVAGGKDRPDQSRSPRDFLTFFPQLEALEEVSRPTHIAVANATARLLRSRATRSDITFMDVVNADYVLYARHLFRPSASTWGDWSPITRPYVNATAPMPFFLNARSRDVFRGSRSVLGVADKDDLMIRFDEHRAMVAQDGYRWRERNNHLTDAILMNLEWLDTN